MRQIMTKIQQLSPSHDFGADVENGIDLLLQYRHLLDQADIKQRLECQGSHAVWNCRELSGIFKCHFQTSNVGNLDKVVEMS
jgi:hypothetical protein